MSFSVSLAKILVPTLCSCVMVVPVANAESGDERDFSLAPGEVAEVDLDSFSVMEIDSGAPSFSYYASGDPAPSRVEVKVKDGKAVVENNCAEGGEPFLVKVRKNSITSPLPGSPDSDCQSVAPGESVEFGGAGNIFQRVDGVILCA
ncbi:hypothetical protein ACUY3L_11315 [Corynebacterium mastitidis]